MRPLILALLLVSIILLILSALGVGDFLVWALASYVGAYLLERI